LHSIAQQITSQTLWIQMNLLRMSVSIILESDIFMAASSDNKSALPKAQGLLQRQCSSASIAE
jgi:hypothetical protein